MSSEFLSSKQAAKSLGITVATLYDWLGQSDRGILQLQGRPVTIEYFQSGGKGQGSIRIEAAEVHRIHELMRVRPRRAFIRHTPVRRDNFPGITVPLGHPDRAC